ncbi:MAG: cytochrome P450 [Mycobacteriaceae bacterium]|nr:cytochrome P450 [Mycobacteriaceae bacterium]
MIEIFDEGFAADPWPVLAELRDDGGVHRVRTPDGPGAWLVTRYHDVRAGLLDTRLTTDIRRAAGKDYRGFGVPPAFEALQAVDADDHARLRGFVAAEMSARRLAEWDDLAPSLIQDHVGRIPPGPLDVVADVALPLPAAVLGELLGLPASVRAALLSWAESTLAPDAAPRARDTLAAMHAVVTATVEGARGADTVLGRLVEHRRTGLLTADELSGLLFYLLFVWYEVLVDLLAGSVLTLLAHVGPRRTSRSGPGSATVDELLRLLSPQVLAGPRFARVDLDIGGHVVRTGETVLLCLAAANHDPAVFDEPDAMRQARNPNPHLGLGHGAVSCLGNALVHKVTAAFLAAWFGRFPATALTADPAEIRWRSGFRHRGPLTVPVKAA